MEYFRGMNSSTMINGKVYVLRVKATLKHDWEAPDVIHGLAHEGSDGLTFTQFKKISMAHKMWFLSKKANDPKNDEYCT